MKNKKHNEDSKVKMMYQLLVSQLEHISLDEFKEFILQQRQEAYEEGCRDGKKLRVEELRFNTALTTQNIMKDACTVEKKQAVREFAEELKEGWKDSMEESMDYPFKEFERGWNTSVGLFLQRIDKALEVYEGK